MKSPTDRSFSNQDQYTTTPQQQKKLISSPFQRQGRFKHKRRSHSDRRSNNIHKHNYGNFTRIRNTIHKTEVFNTDPFGNVINLSKKSFTYNEFKLLNRNLNFIPNPGKYNPFNFELDIQWFYRTIMLKTHFGHNIKPSIDNNEYNNDTNK